MEIKKSNDAFDLTYASDYFALRQMTIETRPRDAILTDVRENEKQFAGYRSSEAIDYYAIGATNNQPRPNWSFERHSIIKEPDTRR